MDKRKINRRDFLKVSAIAFVGTVATACGVAPTPHQRQLPQKRRLPAVPSMPQGSKEPPLLQPKVDAGELPPVDERLPENPVVVGGSRCQSVFMVAKCG